MRPPDGVHAVLQHCLGHEEPLWRSHPPPLASNHACQRCHASAADASAPRPTDPEVGIKSLLDSEIVGPAYYGGGKANYDDRDPYDPYYVEDGRFARFPLRANRTGLCEESRPLFDDAYVEHCKSIMEGEGVYTFRGPANSSGIWMVEPRSDDSYEYVSRRSFYGYANEAGVGDIALPHLIPTYEVLAMATSMPLLTEAASYIMNDPVHGYAHYTLSGLWGGGLEATMCRADALGPAPIPLMEVIKDPSRHPTPPHPLTHPPPSSPPLPRLSPWPSRPQVRGLRVVQPHHRPGEWLLHLRPRRVHPHIRRRRERLC